LVRRSVYEDWWVDPNVISHAEYKDFLNWDVL
jgi:hypothetical protein